MSRLDDFHSYVLSLDPVLYMPLFLGNVDRYDSYGGSATVSGSVAWGKGPRGYGTVCTGTQTLRVIDSGAAAETHATSNPPLHILPLSHLSLERSVRLRPTICRSAHCAI